MASIAEEYLGNDGKLITMSKGRYHWDHPDNLCVFNGVVRDVNDLQLWHGDIDITVSYKKLLELSAYLGQKVGVCYEFQPLPVVEFSPDGSTSILSEYYEVREGTIKLTEKAAKDREQSAQKPTKHYGTQIDFGTVSQLLDLTKVDLVPRADNDAAEELPLIKLIAYITKHCPFVKDIGQVLCSVSTYDKLYTDSKGYLEGLKLHPYEAQKTLGFAFLQYGPVIITNEEANDGFIYFRNEKGSAGVIESE